ncbi:unnamed protein product [Meganyctiphanes norvegica]|uniref:Ion transport domain-containing protein n=1 Tax=Meganyctiphanes norvegica TaxID=48144 RepID=A0AAV2PL50_MEGNR
MTANMLNKIICGSNDTLLSEQLAHLLPQDDHSTELNHVYDEDPVNGTLLHLVARKNMPSVAELLLRKKADPNVRDVSGDKYCPLHYAVEMSHYRVVDVLLQGGANPNSTLSRFRRSSLHLLLDNEAWINNKENHKKTLDALLKNKEINIELQNKDSESPLVVSLYKGWDYMTEQLIIKGATLESDNNNIIEDDDIQATYNRMLGSIQNDATLCESRKKNISEKPRHYNNELKESLKCSDLKKFEAIITHIKQIKSDKDLVSIINSDEDQGKTLLQYACNNGLIDLVEGLIKHGANPLKEDQTNHYSPLLYAAGKGYHKIVQKLTNKMSLDKSLEKGLKQIDKRGESVLHKIVKQDYRSENANYIECLKIIIKYKSKLDSIVDSTDEWGNTPLHYAAHLDDQNFARILLTNGAHLGIKNNYGKLAIANIQPSVLGDALNHCIEPQNTGKKLTADQEFEIRLNYRQLIGCKMSEIECVKFLSRSDGHCHLLCHPVINTFLSLKWQRIQKYYVFNFFLYLLYLVLLTVYILIYHNKTDTLKEQQLNKTIDGNDKPDQIASEPIYLETNATQMVLQITITFITLCIAVKESAQLILSWHSYITSFKNLLEVTIIVMALSLLFVPCEAIEKQHLSAWLILFLWINFILILGCHPKLAIYITMFKRVSRNFIKFIILFSCMILAFSFSFYLVFQFDENFTTIPQTIMRTIVMTTGELEFTALPFTTFPNASQIMFLLFVLFIILVLMNFITGLAVSDITIIQQEAEIYSYRNQVELIAHLETVFLVDRVATHNYALFNTMKVFLKGLLMFPSCLKTERIKMFPNQPASRKFSLGQILRTCLGVLPTQQRKVMCTCKQNHVFHLDQSHVDAAMAVVLAEKDSRMTRLEDRVSGRIGELEIQLSQCMAKLEGRLATMDDTVANLTDMIKVIHSDVVKRNETDILMDA